MKAFFQHLKQNWIKYAFETFVVVIGVLGAYSLNSWNENIQNRRLEQDLLKRLKTELNDNKIRLDSIIGRHQEAVDHSLLVIQLFQEDLNLVQKEALDSIVEKSIGGSFFTFDPRIGHLKSIIYSGQINYISSERLVAMLAQFEDEFNDANEDIIRNIQIWDNQIAPLFFKYTIWPDSEYVNSTFPSDYRGFFSDQGIERWFRFRYVWQVSGLDEEKVLLTKIETMVALIENDLEDK